MARFVPKKAKKGAAPVPTPAQRANYDDSRDRVRSARLAQSIAQPPFRRTGGARRTS